MSPEQQKKLFTEWWPAACLAQRWDPDDRELRLRKIGEIVKRPLASCTDLNNTTDFDVLIPELKRLANPENLLAAVKSINADEAGQRRRLIYLIVPLIQELDGHFGNHYVETILKKRVDGCQRSVWQQLPVEKLGQLLSTLNARAQIYRPEKVTA